MVTYETPCPSLFGITNVKPLSLSHFVTFSLQSGSIWSFHSVVAATAEPTAAVTAIATLGLAKERTIFVVPCIEAFENIHRALMNGPPLPILLKFIDASLARNAARSFERPFASACL